MKHIDSNNGYEKGSFNNKVEPEILTILRNRGDEHYRNSELPSRVKHLWRYSAPDKFVLQELDRLEKEADADLGENELSTWLNNIDGYSLSSEDQLPRGVVLTDLNQAWGHQEDLIKAHLGQLVGYEFGKFESLNLSQWNKGMFLYVPPGIEIDKPVLLSRILTKNRNFERLLIIFAEHSSATIIDDLSQIGEQDFHLNRVSEIYLGKNAELSLVSMQRLSSNAVYFHTLRADVQENATFSHYFTAIGSDISKVNLGTYLSGKNSRSTMTGIIKGEGKQKYDHHTIHHHDSGNTTSDLDVKVILNDQANSTYTGKIIIEENAPVCEAFQENRNLLLSDEAKVNSIPELEIKNDEVSCSHGVTVGNLDPELLFYLTSRGISSLEAEKMIVEGFYNSTLSKFPEIIRENISELLLNNLENPDELP